MPGRAKNNNNNPLVQRVHAAVERIRAMDSQQSEVLVVIATTKFPITFLSSDGAMSILGLVCFMLYCYQRGTHLLFLSSPSSSPSKSHKVK